MKTTAEQREQLAALRWKATGTSDRCDWLALNDFAVDDFSGVLSDSTGTTIGSALSLHEADYIAAAHNALPDLLADITELEAQVQHYRANLRYIADVEIAYEDMPNCAQASLDRFEAAP